MPWPFLTDGRSAVSRTYRGTVLLMSMIQTLEAWPTDAAVITRSSECRAALAHRTIEYLHARYNPD